MTTAPVMTITDELLAELEHMAQEAQFANIGYDWYDEDAFEGFAGDSREAPYMATASPATILALVEHIRSLSERLEKAEKDAGRIDFLEAMTKKPLNQRFGLSLQWLPACEGEPSGYRYMHRHFATDQQTTLRRAIDAAIAQEGSQHE